jgi:prepilin-type N-terminal cleavage/methylation domain-containing protein
MTPPPKVGCHHQGFRGFTLVELLVAIAIILILIAIALPNFLAAQTRSKIARVSSDMRSVAVALEEYQLDYRKYPTMIVPGFSGGVAPLAGSDLKWWYVPDSLSSPIAYLRNANIRCPFGGNYARSGDFPDEIWRRYGYENILELIAKSERFSILVNRYGHPKAVTWTGDWRLQSVGPDREWDPNIMYNPTNGLVTRGDIIQTQKSAMGLVNDSDNPFYR